MSKSIDESLTDFYMIADLLDVRIVFKGKLHR